MSDKPIISANNLSVDFQLSGGFFTQKQFLRAVNNVNLSIPKGSFFGLVGESGSGKTTLGRAFLKAVSDFQTGRFQYFDGEVGLLFEGIVQGRFERLPQTRPTYFPGSLCGAESAHDRARYYCRATRGDGPSPHPVKKPMRECVRLLANVGSIWNICGVFHTHFLADNANVFQSLGRWFPIHDLWWLMRVWAALDVFHFRLIFSIC